MTIPIHRVLRFSALAAAATVVGMILIFLFTGTGQDPLQYVHTSEEYGRILLHNPTALKATVGLDNAFIMFYSATFVALGVLLGRRGASWPLVIVAGTLLALLALLDMAENFHFLSMLARAQIGILPSDSEIEIQVWESLLKFHVGYLGLFLMGFSLPGKTAAQRLFRNLNLYLQMPVGILIYVTPPSVAFPLVFVRFAYFLAALLLAATLFRERDAEPELNAGSAIGASG